MAAERQFKVNLNLNQNQLISAVLEKLAADPTGTNVAGRVYFNTVDDGIKLFTTNDGWVNVLDTTDIDTDGTFASPSNTTVPSTQAVNTFVRDLINGLDLGEAVQVATTGNVNIASELAAGQTIDGYTLVAGDRVLVKDQTDPTENGIYVVPAGGAASRAADVETEIENNAFFVKQGTSNADAIFKLTNDTVTFGTTAITFVEVSSSSIGQATTTVQGIVELATTIETEDRTDTERAVTPSGLVNFAKMYTETFTNLTTLTIPATTHGLGSDTQLTIDVYEAGSPNVKVEICEEVANDGTVTLTSLTPFDGYAVLQG